ncbi:MAG: hypothetical protein K1X87_10285 [Dehalococcoidia bacterium]|nr:hypothetical protein [Dehalococcoidia bacterium]
MGQRTDQAERDVVEQRARIDRRLGELNSQVERGIDDAGQRVREQVSAIKGRASEAAERVPGKRLLDEQVPQHPLTSVAGGFGLGVALGMLRTPGSDGPSANGHGRHDGRADGRRNGHSQQDDHGSGLVDRLPGLALGSLMGPLQQRLGDLAQDAVAGFMGGGSSRNGQQRRDGSGGAREGRM